MGSVAGLVCVEQSFFTRGARNVPKGCGDTESLRLILPSLLPTKNIMLQTSILQEENNRIECCYRH